MWQQWINALLGLIVVVVPFLGLTSETMTWTLAITGLVIAALGAWGGMYEQSEQHRRELRSA